LIYEFDESVLLKCAFQRKICQEPVLTALPNGYLKFLIPYVIIQSFSYGFAKDSLTFGSPFVFMGLRYLLGGGILVLAVRKLTLNKNTLLISTFTVISTLTWIGGLEYVSPGDSAVLSSTLPLFAIPIAILVLKERPVIWEIVGLVIGFAGVLIYSISLSHGSLLVGALSTLASSASFAIFSVLFRRARNENPASIVGSQYIIGSLFLFMGSIFYHQIHLVEGFYIDLVYMAVPAAAIQLYLWNRMLASENVAKITTMIFAIPVLTVAVQSVETFVFPSIVALFGVVVIFAGIYISSRSRLR
jgi:drug/metabolite transporter (DMT)-like permease